MKISKLRTTVFFTIFTIFFSVLVGSAEAASQVAIYKINSKEESAKFNPSRGDVVNFEIAANVPVKFNTIALCSTGDSVCSRMTAVKYFTQTDFGLQVSKEWDGKTSKGVIVADGDYKIKVTMKDESNQEKIQELSPYIITVDSSFSGSSGSKSSVSSENSSSWTSSSAASSSVSASSGSYSISTHSNPEELSTGAKSSRAFEVNAGRERLAYIGVPVDFLAEYSTPKLSEYQTVIFKWSFGDGGTGEGRKVSHTYKFPGDYTVVVKSSLFEMSTVSRTNVKILSPSVFISKVGSDFVEIANNGQFEINLGGWSVSNGRQKFIFPQDTIIGVSKKIIFSSDYTKLNFNSGDMAFLENPSFKEISRFALFVNNNDSSSLAGGNSSLNLDNDPVVIEIRNFIKNANKNASSSSSARVYVIKETKNSASTQSLAVTDKDEKIVATNDVENNESPSEFKETATLAATAETKPKVGGFFRNIIYLPISGFNLIAKTFYGGN